MKKLLITAAASAAIFSSIAMAGTWTPIPGIPAPSFGIVEEAPPLPADWSEEVPGFFYVCNSCSGAGNSSFGTPESPRSNLPNNISNGDVVVLAGTINGITTSFGCSSDAPCFLIGDPSNPPTINGGSSFSGSYYIVDGVHVTLQSNESGSTLALGGDHGAFRNGRITGNTGFGGAFTRGNDIVVFGSEITDNGNVNATNDQDRHGIKVGGSNIWIIGNEFARNSGDGVQVGDIGTRDSVQNIYIGDNISHNNKQTGFWVKEAQHVVISSNLSYGHTRSGSSDGEGMGGQYDPHYVWFLFNEVYDCVGGIGFKSGNNGNGSNFYVIGNYIHDNVNTGYNPGDAWDLASINSWNSADITIANNTIDSNTGGINLNGNTGSAFIFNNSITNMQLSNAVAINAADSGDVDFEEANAFDGDQIIDTGIAPPSSRNPYAIFEAQYGLSIMVDFEGKSRPIRQWDIGAYESIEAAGLRPMAPVLESVN